MLFTLKCYASYASIIDVKRSHNHQTDCPVARSLDIFGDRWSLLIVRDLLFFGRHEYKDLLAAGETISSNTLTERLDRLQRAGLIASAPHPASKRRKFYYLTTAGKHLAPVVVALIGWADQHLTVQIPQAQRALMRQQPDTVITHAHTRLAQWEQTNLKAQPDQGST